MFLLSVLLVAGSLGLAVWIVVTGQAAYMDGIFLLLVCLVFALVFAICAFLVVKAGLQAAGASAKPSAPTSLTARTRA